VKQFLLFLLMGFGVVSLHGVDNNKVSFSVSTLNLMQQAGNDDAYFEFIEKFKQEQSKTPSKLTTLNNITGNKSASQKRADLFR